MKKLVILLMVLIGLYSCENSRNTNEASKAENKKDGVEILYFHGKQRCITCNAIEKLTREVVEQDFKSELNDEKLTFKVIDISKEENRKMAERYEVSWSSLFLSKWDGNKEQRIDMTNCGFSYAKNSPDIFKDELKKEISKLLK